MTEKERRKLEFLRNSRNYWKRYALRLANERINPPVLLDPDAARAKAEGIKQGRQQVWSHFTQLLGRLYWRRH